ncbi:MAG: 50S ribosomal protein L11 methyltransferase [gamma proteobacterium symbiont of Lucinoma myriamae]|nr:50S ribosomal protein L11 methyltransferase [gamma proteobacterium symbiont of Lucinoma myriamae]MCU7819726.1 50S ribosomal protein L11 methyltransferase [gamma proteobacterium symbiont of Lucinoma myriamae]MCU7832399.1 50S ribosomal protein L11 methyltransferase [gamma proteobacterium symbiont of Lucinoma myriamae]
MAWLQLTLEATHSNSEQLSDLLSQAGAVAVTMQDALDDPIFEPPPGSTPLWKELLLTGLFEADIEINSVLSFIEANYGELPSYTLNPLEDKDWIRAWMDDFKPMQFGQRLWICPSWHIPPDSDAVNIMLDPGLAFGTGTHPTTSLCLQWLDQHFHDSVEVIDYGCGSGILGIAANLLGADKVYAVDLDPQALMATQANAKKNVSDRLETYSVPGFKQQFPTLHCPLLIANILAAPLVDLAPMLASHVSPNGKIVLSGILAEQAEKVSTAYQKWFKIDDLTQEDDWVRIVGTKLE